MKKSMLMMALVASLTALCQDSTWIHLLVKATPKTGNKGVKIQCTAGTGKNIPQLPQYEQLDNIADLLDAATADGWLLISCQATETATVQPIWHAIFRRRQPKQ